MTIRFLIIPFLFMSIPLCAEEQKEPNSKIEWVNMKASYSNFQSIRPQIINSGTRPVFLSRIYPHGSAQLVRFNEATNSWEQGRWSFGCGTVENPTTPILVAPSKTSEIHVYWQLSTDDWNHPRAFQYRGELRPLKGRYKLYLRYSRRPWVLFKNPGPIYFTESPEFEIIE